MSKERIIYFDVLNIVSCISVIWLHCNSILYRYDLSKYWYLSLFVQVAAHFAVPCFYMISGANLMNYRKHYSTREFAIKRITRIVIPFLLWSGVCLVANVSQGTIYVDDVRSVFFLFLTHTIENTYWFFFPLLGIYLCIPVLSLIAKPKYLDYFLYLALLGILINSVFPYFMQRIALGYTDDIMFPMAMGYLPYALMGYYLANKKISLPASVVIYVTGILCALYMFFGTIRISEQSGGFFNDLIDYQSFASYGYAFAVFLLFKQIGFEFLKHPRLIRFLSVVSGASFGVYLIHMLIMGNLTAIARINPYDFGWQLFGQWPVYLIGLAIVLIVKKIPYLGKIVFP